MKQVVIEMVHACPSVSVADHHFKQTRPYRYEPVCFAWFSQLGTDETSDVGHDRNGPEGQAVAAREDLGDESGGVDGNLATTR